MALTKKAPPLGLEPTPIAIGALINSQEYFALNFVINSGNFLRF